MESVTTPATGNAASIAVRSRSIPAPIRGREGHAGETVQERRLARVGVPDERDDGRAHPTPPGALEAAVDLDPLELAPDLHDAAADDAAVGLELGLARTPRADAAAETLEVAPLSHEPRQEIGELGELHLELALARARALREDVEDQSGPVDHFDPE